MSDGAAQLAQAWTEDGPVLTIDGEPVPQPLECELLTTAGALPGRVVAGETRPTMLVHLATPGGTRTGKQINLTLPSMGVWVRPRGD